MNIKYVFRGGKYSAVINSAKPLRDAPRSYKKIGIASHNIGNDYNSSLMTIYLSGGRTMFSMYRDGCFWEYFGQLTNIRELS